jgi:hypothetical protein
MVNPTEDPGMFRAAIDHMVSLWCMARGVPPGEEVTVSAVEEDDVLTLVIGVGDDAGATVRTEHGSGEVPPLRELADLSDLSGPSMPFGVLVIGHSGQESGPAGPDAAPGPDDRSFWPADVLWTGNGGPR